MQKLSKVDFESTAQLYGLLDVKENFFYIVHFDKTIIEHIENLVSVHRNVCVIDLHTCTNWYHTIIDASNCHNWGVNAFFKTSRTDSLQFNNLCLLQNNNVLNDYFQTLKFNLEFVLKILFSIPKVKLPENFSPTLIMFADDNWIKQAQQYEDKLCQDYKFACEKSREIIRSFLRIAEIDRDDYCVQIKNKIDQFCCYNDEHLLNGMVHV